MARNGPLIPVVILGGLILLVVVALFVLSRPGVRQRWQWLFPEAAAHAALGLIHLLFFWQPYRSEALVPKGGGDLVSFFFPMHVFAAEEIGSGRLPFWNPHLYSGMPHLANFQTATLYPPNLIAYLLSSPFSYAALERLALAHYLIASIGVYWLARSLGVSRPGAVLAGSIFAYSGFMVAHLGHYSMLSTAAWAPFVFAAIVGTIRWRSWPIALAGTLALTLAILGGHQPILLLTLTVALLLGLFELWRATGYLLPGDWVNLRRNREFGSAVGRLAFMPIVAVMLTVPVLAPSLAMTQHTVRSGLSYAAASEFSVDPVALLHLVLPTVYGSNPTDYWGSFSSTETWGYAGVLGVGLAVFGLLVWPSRTRVFWAVIGVAAVLFALGPLGSLHGWAYAFVPGFDQIRGAGRGYMFFNLAVALLAGFGLSAMLQRRDRWFPQQARLTRASTFVLGGALAVVVAFVAPLFAVQVLGTNDPGNRPIIALGNVNMLIVWLLLGLGVVMLVHRRALAPATIVVMVTTVVLLDIFHATGPFNPTTDPILEGFEHEEAVTYLQEQYQSEGPFRIESVTPRWQPDLARIAGLDDIAGLVDPLALAAYEPFLQAARADRQSDEYRQLNVRYVISDVELEAPGAGFDEVLRTGDGLVIWEADEWRPRAWMDASGDPALVSENRPGRMRIELPADASGTLVVSQVDYPGWKASAHGQSLEIQPYNGVLQAVEVPAGATSVELTFRPVGWTLWLFIAGIGALVWLGTTVVTVLAHTSWGRRRLPT